MLIPGLPKSVLLIPVQVIGIVLLADFLSGVFLWLEDSYGSESTPLIGKLIVAPNVIHHRQPRLFTRSPFWRRNGITALLSLLIFCVVAGRSGITWQLGLFCLLGAFCNEVHCWAHRSPEENGALITALHRLGIFQTPAHHAVHHTDPKNRAYCVLTNFSNRLLDRIEFWRRTEHLIALVLRFRPRPDASVANPSLP